MPCYAGHFLFTSFCRYCSKYHTMNTTRCSLFLLMILTWIMTSCDPCKDISCMNGAACDKGKCMCVTGFEGDLCETAMRDKMLGTYTGTLKCNDGEDDMTYDIVISTFSGNPAKITISEDGRAEFQCDIKSTNTFSMKYADFIFSSEILYYDGEIDGDNITIKYRTTDWDNNPLKECTYTGKRKK